MVEKNNEPKYHIEIEGNTKGIVVGDNNTVKQTFIEKVFHGINENVFRKHTRSVIYGFWGLAALGMIGFSVVIYLMAASENPGVMDGDFNIAVAGFVVIGNPEEKELGKMMGENVYLHLDNNLTEMAPQLKSISPDFIIRVWNPKKVGNIRGKTRDQRAEFASKLAGQIKADMIVYGLVDTTKFPWEVTPEFFISENSFYDAQEIVGPHEIGSTFTIPGQGSVATKLSLSDQMSNRVKALSIISVGLSFYSVYEYDKSLEILRSALEIENWHDDQGKEVLYLLLGNAASKSKQYSDAEKHYLKSLSIDPEYARAKIGMGSVNYIKSLIPFEKSKKPEDVDNDLLDLSINWYEDARVAKNRPALADVETKVHFGLGQCYLMKVYSGQEKWFDQAEQEFIAVVNEYSNGKNPRVRELAAEAHARLGLIYTLSGNIDDALYEYEEAAKLIYDNPERQSVWTERINKLREVQKNEARPGK